MDNILVPSGRTTRRFRGLFHATFLCFIPLVGCSYMGPYVARDVVADPTKAGEVMPLSTGALSKLNKWISGVDKAHDNVTLTRRGLNLLTFGLLTGGAIGAVREVSSASIRDMALGAGAIYTGTNLFVPNDQVVLYNSATTALMCIRGRASGLRANVVTQKEQLAAESPLIYRGATFSPVGCTLDPTTEASFSTAHLAYQGAAAAVQQAELADAVVAGKVEEAGQNVIVALNTQLDLLAPSQDAILASAKSTVSIAGSLRVQPAATIPSPAAAANCQSLSPQVLEKARVRFATMANTYDSVQTAITQQINSVASLDTACTLTPLQFAPVALNNSEVTISKDSKVNIAISGGTGSYFWTAVGVPPPSDITVDVIAGTLIITGKSTVTAGPPYTIAVQDRSALPKPANLKITTR